MGVDELIEIKKSRINQGKIEKKIFSTIEEAKDFLSVDPLACIYRNAKEVTVITAYGSGKFKVEDWDKEK